MATVLHFASLQQAAGVEAHFTEFIEQAQRRFPSWRHVYLNPHRHVHRFFEQRLDRALQSTVHSKHRWGMKIPSIPSGLRRWHCRQQLGPNDIDLAVIWNRTARSEWLLDTVGAERCIHWEHGGAWHSGREKDRARYLARIPLAITNSRAAARVLALKWQYTGGIEICRNAVRPTLMPDQASGKSFPDDRPIRLGVAARLFPVKGVPIAMRALTKLNAAEQRFELLVAGEGPEREHLEALARSLGISGQCRFLGAVDDMTAFYRSVDCLLHTPLTEAFGLVAIEAAAHGCVVVVADVDGLPEAIEHGVSGLTVQPELPLGDYVRLGGRIEGIPDRVYDPVRDELCLPKVIDPARLAATLRSILMDKPRFERLSASAAEHIAKTFRFESHVDRVMTVIRGVHDSLSSGREPVAL